MNLLFIIGTFGAILFLWLYPSKRKVRSSLSSSNRSQQGLDVAPDRLIDFNQPTPDALLPTRRKLSAEEEQWFVDHTDPVFGRPVGLEPPPHNDGGDDHTTPNEYFVSFLDNVRGTIPVSTDEFPLIEQKRIFLWLKANMTSISEIVPKLLLEPFEKNPEEGESFFGPPAMENAKKAFDSKYITGIALKGTHPVSWTIRFDHATDQDVYGRVEGEGESAKSAVLWM